MHSLSHAPLQLARKPCHKILYVDCMRDPVILRVRHDLFLVNTMFSSNTSNALVMLLLRTHFQTHTVAFHSPNGND
uniref:p8 protein n=1 Tax=Schistosoma japonicum TaxID=6182 RepID=Q8MUM8_SCHJA|nr:P8 protein [Schistosoma japonicum]